MVLSYVGQSLSSAAISPQVGQSVIASQEQFCVFKIGFSEFESHVLGWARTPSESPEPSALSQDKRILGSFGSGVHSTYVWSSALKQTHWSAGLASAIDEHP